MLPRRRVPQSQGEGHEAGRQPLLPAQELRLRIGRRGHRLPLRRAARRHHGGGDHHVRLQLQEQQVRRRRRPRRARARRTPGPLMGVLRAGRDPAGDRGEHEQRAALRPGVDGRRLLRRQGRRVRRRRRAGSHHGAPNPRPHLRHRIRGGGLEHDGVRQGRRRLHNYHPCRRGNRRGRGTAGRAIQAMIDRTRRWGGPTGEGIDGTLRCSSRKGQAEWGHLLLFSALEWGILVGWQSRERRSREYYRWIGWEGHST